MSLMILIRTQHWDNWNYYHYITFCIFENNPDIKTTCDWFAMNIYYVPNRGKMFYIIIKQLHKNWMISIKYS